MNISHHTETLLFQGQELNRLTNEYFGESVLQEKEFQRKWLFQILECNSRSLIAYLTLKQQQPNNQLAQEWYEMERKNANEFIVGRFKKTIN